ncbi:extracellular solute-binding protein [Paenibacillus koleovorans]|uniref:extracellular solute-binding protein n=1 Tax=Paenibacillus koleovorans TaxID=121608 RepID=UPI000FD89FE7|nr:extracellular solute-binding protein [Paenibacillus koleovorans]
MPKKKKVALATASVVLLTGVLSACGSSGNEGNNTTTPSESAKPTASAASNPMPIVKEGSVTLSIGVPDNPYAPKSYTQNLPVWAEIEKRTGVKIKWDVTPSAQYNQSMNIRMAAATELPDIFQLPSDPVTAAEDGLIIPLNDLIDKHAPNIKKYFETYPNIKKLLTAPDGKIYTLTNDVSGTGISDPFGWLIRKDWLDKLGLKEPTTLDEWYTVLKAFKEKDPNGNGKQDEIPLAPQYNWAGLSNFGKAMGLQLGNNYSDGWAVDSAGKVSYEWMNPKTKDLIVWLNKLYNEGIIDPEFVTKRTSTQIQPDIVKDLVGVTQGFVNNTAKFEAAQNKPGVKWEIVAPPANAGVKGYYEKYGPISGYYGISKTAKNPEIAIKWLDYVWASEEGARFTNYGIEGTSYTMVNGKPQFTDFVLNNPDKLAATDALRSIGAFPSLPWIRDDKAVLSNQAIDLIKNQPNLMAQVKKMEPYMKDPIPFRSMMATKEEAENSKRLSTDINTYLEETMLKFIMGKEPIDWDKFTKRMKELKIDDIVAIKQAQYDRYLKAK